MQTYPFDTSVSPVQQISGRNLYYVEGSAGGADAGVIISPARGGSSFELLPGQGVRLPESNAQNFIIEVLPRTPGVTVRGKLLVGDGVFWDARVAGAVSILDEIAETARSYSQSLPLAIAAFTATNVLPVAENPRGFVIRSLHGYAQSGASGAMLQRIYASATAPSAFAPAGNQLMLADFISSNGALVSYTYPDLKKRIPAGWGVWAVTSIVTTAANQANVSLSGEPL